MMTRKFTFSVLILFISQSLIHAQPDYNKGFQFHAAGLMIYDFAINYSYKLKEKKYLEVDAGIRPYLGSGTVNGGTFNQSKVMHDLDYYKLYNYAHVGIGIKKYKQSSYVGYMINYKFGIYNNLRFNAFYNEEGDAYDVDYVISRKRHVVDAILKIGWTFQKSNHTLWDIYLGFGAKYAHSKEQINGIYYFGNDHAENVPAFKVSDKVYPSLHFNVLLGLWR